MIVIDTSAVIAIFRQEPEARRFADAIARDDEPVISAASVLEASIVLRAGKDLPAAQAEEWLDAFLDAARIRVEPVSVAQGTVAREAHRAFGKGSGHPAALNYGDCFSYALAKILAVPLLFNGNDFARTDLAAV